MHQYADITTELLIKPYRSGIQLVRPEEGHGSSLGAIYDTSISTYFMNTESRNVSVNEACSELCGGTSTRDLIGVDAHDLWDRESAYKIQANDGGVMTNETLLITDDSAIRKVDYSQLQMISFKMPWYEQNNIIGIYGMTLQLNPQALGEFTKNLTTIVAAGLVKGNQLSNFQTLNQQTDQVYLSKREIDIIKLLVQNLTAKQIAERLFISNRTVENYLVNIKIKTNCNSKFELIEKFYWKIKASN